MEAQSLREAAILTFTFKFVDKNGKSDGFISKLGRINRGGLILDESTIMYQDIYRVERFKNKIVVVLMPFSAIGPAITEHIFEDYTSIMLHISGFAERVQSIINKRVSNARLLDKKRSMTPEEVKERFRVIDCPNCDATLDLTDLKPSQYIFCKYCDSLFDKHKYLIPGGEDYRNCPETSLFDRVRSNSEYSFYATRQSFAFRVRRYQCGDTFAHILFQRNILKNFTLLIGVPLALYAKYRSTNGRSPAYPEMVKANLLALEGKIEDAEIIYSSLLMRNPNHPGLHLNLGLAYLKAEKKLKALSHFRRSLEGCSNYKPTLRILEKYSDEE
ncbi:hypothetical protein R9C00_13985 [Flammeovirgaceae bacterium SG7u.111]|nr:hypothetical protein [Flammeovirgaceae bacterium SG7u.132]WPO38566.1 hypothetical protein R9C00_13985 [Flammeovirgaceae bacterium SG7u.111]